MLSLRLSAFVVKCFHEAQDVLARENSETAIDDSTISTTLDWLLRQQKNNGSFFEPPLGRVIHVDMQVTLRLANEFVVCDYY
jgi:CD109 antigen